MVDENDALRAKMWKGSLMIRYPELRVLTLAIESIEVTINYLANIATEKYQWKIKETPKKEQIKKLSEFLRADFAAASKEIATSIKHLETSVHDTEKIQEIEAAVIVKLQKNHAPKLTAHNKTVSELLKYAKDLQSIMDDMAKKELDNTAKKTAHDMIKTLTNLSKEIGLHKAKMLSVFYLYSREVKPKKPLFDFKKILNRFHLSK